MYERHGGSYYSIWLLYNLNNRIYLFILLRLSAVIMFVVEREEVNVYDQRLLEYQIKER